LRFDLIDQVLERQPDRLVAIKNVTLAEEYLADHFPGFPVLPGVLMLEALAQAGRLLVQDRLASEGQASESERAAAGRVAVTEVRNLRYGNMVRPGQSLKVEVTLRGCDENGWDLAGVGRVDEQVAVQGRFRLGPVPR
jgi:3-hydroxyacyl-[acyl-carrier-protein] dehydratase